MQGRIGCDLLLKGLLCLATLSIFITVCKGGELSESKLFFNFIRAVDPMNTLRISWKGSLQHPCSNRLKGLKCNYRAMTIVEIRFENKNLSGVIDANSLCKLPNLRVLSLARNLIRGFIPESILQCTSLTHLNLSSNLLNGNVPVTLTKLKNLRSLDISDNHFTGMNPNFNEEFKNLNMHSMESRTSDENGSRITVKAIDAPPPGAEGPNGGDKDDPTVAYWLVGIPLVLGVGLLFFLTVFVKKKSGKLAKEKDIMKATGKSPLKIPSPKPMEEEVKPEGRRSELVFFVEESERFKLEDLLEAAADMQNQNPCSSLYKVTLKNKATYAVKRMKKLQVSFEEFGKTMRKIGTLKHPNILPLSGYNSTIDEKLLIYRYQRNGSLLNLLENYIEGKRDFPWILRLSIARGIAKGLNFIYQSSDDQGTIPHGNIKPSNIMLNENEEPLISEYGFSRFLDPKKGCLQSNGYRAPEKSLTEQGDVYSFGVILLELLTGKTVGKSGLDLPKWVKSMVREEWTGEVFDKEVIKAGKQWAFPLLNISLMCVSHSPENRPSMAEVLEKIEEVLHSQEDISISSVSSIESTQQDSCLLHTIIPETWDSPGSNC